ncbi:hypothetical protein N7541_011802 [Penicillium brevicompactum]|uniref:Uncharacterized protein n=1 Tax=Penicillium brevicompactum TaxID=5074 RepID=A0A9W9UIR5_PENBR|nr:hypothetical protein N7541_011802 [Penicillium brevicompactum]
MKSIGLVEQLVRSLTIEYPNDWPQSYSRYEEVVENLNTSTSYPQEISRPQCAIAMSPRLLSVAGQSMNEDYATGG